MRTRKVVISEFIDEEALVLFPPAFEIVYDPTLVDDTSRLLETLHAADALIVRNRTQVTKSMLLAATHLKVVGRLGVGLDNIDLAACEKRDVQVLPATGANTQCVAEYVIAAMFHILRPIFTHNAKMIAGNWPRAQLSGTQELTGQVIGLIGFGAIGQAVAQRCLALGLEVLAYDPHAEAIPDQFRQLMCNDFNYVLRRSDIISLHVPYTASTRHLINYAALMEMKSSALLINTARGGVVDEDALVDVMRTGQLMGAVLDVFEKEPLNEAAAQKFSSLDNLVLTPHVSGLTTEGNARVSTLTVQNVVNSLTAQRSSTDSCNSASTKVSDQHGETL